jgi:hypothetical protein
MLLDLGGKVIEANLAAERLLGQPLAHVVAQPGERWRRPGPSCSAASSGAAARRSRRSPSTGASTR